MMSNNPETPPLVSDADVIALLPLYLTARLDETDRIRIERWLQSAPLASKALERASEELAATREANEAIRVPAGALARLNADIAKLPRKQTGASWLRSFGENVANVFDFGDRRLAWATASAMVLALFVYATVFSGPRGGYELASGEEQAVSLDGPAARVVFVPETTMADITSLLAKYDAELIGGPRGKSAFDIRFRPSVPETAAERMRQFAGETKFILLFQEKPAAKP